MSGEIAPKGIEYIDNFEGRWILLSSERRVYYFLISSVMPISFCGHQPCGQIKSPDVERIHVVAPSFTMNEIAQEWHPETLAHAPYHVSDVAAAFGKFYPGANVSPSQAERLSPSSMSVRK